MGLAGSKLASIACPADPSIRRIVRDGRRRRAQRRHKPELQPARAKRKWGFVSIARWSLASRHFREARQRWQFGLRDRRGAPDRPGVAATGREAVQHLGARTFA